MPTNKPEYQVPYYKAWYQTNKEVQKAACSERRKRVANENRQNLLAYLANHSCVDCGESDVIVLQFDHVRDIKKYDIGTMVSRGCSWSTIQQEIEKCDVRCANCHMRRTAHSQGWFKAGLSSSALGHCVLSAGTGVGISVDLPDGVVVQRQVRSPFKRAT